MTTTAPSTSPLLEVSHLAVSFTQYDRGLRRREVQAVADMSLDVRAGEVVALVGASGAGKSLLGHAVLGLLPPNATETGRVTWQGTDVDLAARRRLAGHGIALLPQALSHLDPTATVGAQVRRAARLAGVPRARTRQVALEAVVAQGLDPSVLRLHPHQLSGGMGRRVLTAIALMGDPALVIADEPTPGLALESVTAVLQRLRDLADAGRAVLLITHEIAGALTVADRVVVVERGRTLEEAPVGAFTGDGSALSHPYSRALWQALPQNGFALPAARLLDAPVPAAAALLEMADVAC
ncbi:ATP-binding cassette domain-containing protein [Nocardioides daphniae]|uniref:Nickel import system ATP-binding protein NikD n=1 Tax=Nocardioides daphniae TaxID=402297 RepID=A0ABQ1PXK4_9ACTN|nr:ATP-binding cassette domain-containing protein [Nocardioides daphniae]GGD06245.1 ABC transporter ATP-binding protein [Nocardioides daphniae]